MKFCIFRRFHCSLINFSQKIEILYSQNRRKCLTHFNNISERLTNIFSTKFVIGISFNIFGTRAIQPLSVLTIFGQVIYLRRTFRAKFYLDIFIGTWFVYCKGKNRKEFKMELKGKVGVVVARFCQFFHCNFRMSG